MLALLKRLLPHKDMGWAEEFTRFQLLRTPWFQLLLHRFNAPRWHPQCHDHPWWFVSLILAGGYLERDAGGDINWRPPWSIQRHPAAYAHNVVTDGVAWSLVLTGPKERDWSHVRCDP